MKKEIFVFFLLLTILSLIQPYGMDAQKKKYVGKATYYSHKFSGRKMANGDRYSIRKLTCAHKTFPMGTKLKVKNLENGKEVVVEVTDRGPYSRKYMIDLSYEAAKEIDLLHEGIGMVEVSPYNDTEIPFRDNYSNIADSDLLIRLNTPKTLPKTFASIKHPDAPSSGNSVSHALRVRPDLISFNRLIEAEKQKR